MPRTKEPQMADEPKDIQIEKTEPVDGQGATTLEVVKDDAALEAEADPNFTPAGTEEEDVTLPAGETEETPEDTGESTEETTGPSVGEPEWFTKMDNLLEGEGGQDAVVAEVAKDLNVPDTQAKAMFEKYIEGQKAIVKNFTNEVHAAAGGEKKFAELAAFARDTMSTEQLEAHEASLKSLDINKGVDAITEIRKQYEAKFGTDGVTVGGTQPAGAPVLRTQEEIAVAMRDPRYKPGTKYWHQVQNAVKRGL